MKTLLTLFFCVAWTPFASAAPATPSPTKVKLALNWKAEPQFGGFYAAKLDGAFKKHNLDVEIIEGGSGTPTVQMVAGGQVDFGIVSAEEILISRDHGGDVVGVFAAFQTNPQAIMTHESQHYHSLKDLFASDGTLAWQSGLSYAQYLQKKYPNSKVQKVPYAGGIGSFVKNPKFSQQCFFTSEPLLAMAAGESVKTFLIADEGFNPYTTVVATTRAKIKAHPEIVAAMVQAVREGWTSYLQNPDAVNRSMSGLNHAMDLQTFAKSAQAQKPLIETAENKNGALGKMSEKRWQELSTQLRELQLFKKAPVVTEAYQNF
jgi:NitT/TauT family transport system substrate-binding protein